MAKTWRRRSPYANRRFRAYAQAIGEFSLAWNELHEAMGGLFMWAVTSGKLPSIGLEQQLVAIWGDIANDRQKRTILTVALARTNPKEHKRFPKLSEDVGWIIERSNSLEEQRNNVLHSPLSQADDSFQSRVLGIPAGTVLPTGQLHYRAMRLSAAVDKGGRELLGQIRFYRDYAVALTYYERRILRAWQNRQSAWPTRPALPRVSGAEEDQSPRRSP